MSTLLRARTLSVVGFLVLAMCGSGLLTGCYSTRWHTFDEGMQAEIGVKNKDYYIVQWGPPHRLATLEDGGAVLTWEWQGFVRDRYSGHSQGWQKTLKFSPEGVVEDYSWQYWGMPVLSL